MKTILYVHDQQESPTPVASYLEMAGYQVEFAISGEQCIQRLAKGLPNVVLIDVLIEGRNGFEVCRILRKQFTAEQLPIILCSSIYRSRVYREEAMQAGAQLYVLKPFQFDALLQMVHELLDVHACLLSAHTTQGEVENVHSPTRESNHG
ncbi:MAG: response regulator [Planctomycetes bacterium]|nr:response regulator [Planctomycetota bacterium]